MSRPAHRRPALAFVAAAWSALVLGIVGIGVGLWHASFALSEKGFYVAVLALGLFAAVSLQKVVRDRAEAIPVSGTYYGITWVAFATAVVLLVLGLWNAAAARSEKGFYGMAFALALFGSIVVQKNVRDLAQADDRAPAGEY
jgi:uncharacterized membrane protein YiaA